MKTALSILFIPFLVACSKQTEFEYRLEKCLNLRAQQQASIFYDRELADYNNPIHLLEKEIFRQNGFQDISKNSYKKLLESLKQNPNSLLLNLDSTTTQLLWYTLISPSGNTSDLGCYEMLVNIEKIHDKPFQKEIYELLLKAELNGDFLTYDELNKIIDLIPDNKFDDWIYRHPIIQTIYARNKIKTNANKM